MRRAEVPHCLAARSIMIGRIANDHHGVLAVLLHHLGLNIGRRPSFAAVPGELGTVAKIGANPGVMGSAMISLYPVTT